MVQHPYTLETYGELWMVIRVIHGALKAYPAIYGLPEDPWFSIHAP